MQNKIQRTLGDFSLSRQRAAASSHTNRSQSPEPSAPVMGHGAKSGTDTSAPRAAVVPPTGLASLPLELVKKIAWIEPTSIPNLAAVPELTAALQPEFLDFKAMQLDRMHDLTLDYEEVVTAIREFPVSADRLNLACAHATRWTERDLYEEYDDDDPFKKNDDDDPFKKQVFIEDGEMDGILHFLEECCGPDNSLDLSSAERGHLGALVASRIGNVPSNHTYEVGGFQDEKHDLSTRLVILQRIAPLAEVKDPFDFSEKVLLSKLQVDITKVRHAHQTDGIILEINDKAPEEQLQTYLQLFDSFSQTTVKQALMAPMLKRVADESNLSAEHLAALAVSVIGSIGDLAADTIDVFGANLRRAVTAAGEHALTVAYQRSADEAVDARSHQAADA